MSKTLQPLNQSSRNELQKLTQNRALYLVAQDLRMTGAVITRALAGLPIQQASRALIEVRLQEWSAGTTAALGSAAA